MVWEIKNQEVVIEPEADGEGKFAVYGYGVYPESSVVAGQPRRSYLNGPYDSVADAKRDFPKARVSESSGFVAMPEIPAAPPAWFDPTAIGESWDGD